MNRTLAVVLAAILVTSATVSLVWAQAGSSAPLSGPVMPAACGVPAPDTLLGSAGVSSECLPNADASRPTAVQAANTTLDSSCNWTVTFTRAFTSSSPIVHANVAIASPTQPVPCITATRSSTTQTGKCFPAQNTLLSLSIITTGLTLAPFAATCTAGTPVMVVGREPTQ